MPAWRLRDYHDEDLDQAISVWDQSRGPGSAEPVFSVAEVMAAAHSAAKFWRCQASSQPQSCSMCARNTDRWMAKSVGRSL